MKATTILFCLFVLLAVFGITDARRLAQKTRPSKTTEGERKLSGGPNCFNYWDCFLVNIPDLGEEESCNLIKICY